MIVEQTFQVRAPLQPTAEFFLDIDRVSRCVPGVDDVEEVEPGQYQALLGVRLGPIKAAFQGSMALDDAEAPHRLRATAQGRDKATGSVAKVAFTADLREDEPGVTTVVAVTDLSLRGRMAQFGTGVIRAAAGELVDEFAACVNASLDAASTPTGATASAGAVQPPAPRSAPGLARILARSMWKALKQTLRRLVGRGDKASERPAGSIR